MVQIITTLSQFNNILSSGESILVDFMATWCQPCIQIAPRLDELSKQYPKIKFYKVDVDQSQDIAEKENISAMPTFHFYSKGKLMYRVVGANLPAIKQKLLNL